MADGLFSSRWFRGVLAAVLVCAPALACAKPARPAAGTIALTFDDLPGIVLKPDQDYVDATNARLLAALKAHHFPAIGFVNEGKLNEIIRTRQIAVLQQWIDAGFPLGNHTYSHVSPNDVGAAGYIADIARGEVVIRPMMARAHRELEWFRHPYLETGSPEAVKAEIDAWLAKHSYRIAPVTLDCDDWEFAEPYDSAVMRGNAAEARRIRESYIAYTTETLRWYRKAAHALFGRDIAYVMLLHDTRLNADSFEALADLFKAERLKPVTLERAMRDPAYKTPDTYAGKDGDEWLERWSQSLNKELPWDDFHEVPKDIEKEYNRLDGK